MRWLGVALLLSGPIAVAVYSQTVTTVAGSGIAGSSGDNGPATQAKIETAHGVAVDGQGNVYIADTRNHRVRKVVKGNITTVAGTGQEGFSGDGGPGTAAQLSFPRGVAVDKQGNLYISDTGNSRIRRVSAGGTISTIAGTGVAGFDGDGGPATNAQLNYPRGLVLDSEGNLYVADSWNFRIRRITTAGTIETVAGNGSSGPFGDGRAATSASLGLIDALAFDGRGNLYLSDQYQHTIRKVVADGTIATVVGGGFGPASDGGLAAAATLKFPKGLAADSEGNLFLADTFNHRVRRVLPNGVIGTVAGNGTAGFGGDGGTSTAAQLNSPSGVALDSQANALYLSDGGNYRIRKVSGWPNGPVIVSVLNAAGGKAVIAPGAFAQISGVNLAPKTDTWDKSIVNAQLPTQVDGVSVTVGGKPAYVYFISPGQINIITPDVSMDSALVQVTTGGVTSIPFSVAIQKYSPAFFLWGGSTYAVATHADYSGCAKAGLIPGYTTTPAVPGEWITFWGNGFGPTDVALGIVTPSDKPHVTAAVTALVGGIGAPVYDGTAVLMPGGAGLYQLAIQIPASTPDGDVPVRVMIGGVQSPENVFITVQR